MATLPVRTPKGCSVLYEHIAYTPELGLFRRFAAFWAKKVHDDTSEFLACRSTLDDELRKVPGLDGKTVLDCPLRLVKEKCSLPHSKPLFKAWTAYDKALMRYGETLCRSEQIMKLPDQHAFTTRHLTDFRPPTSASIFEQDTFVPTGEPASTYRTDPEEKDTCAWRTLPHEDFLTTRLIQIGPWIEDHIVSRWQRLFTRSKHYDPTRSAVMRYERIVSTMDLLSCLLASVLLIVTVLILALVHPLKYRLAVVGVFGSLFAMLLKLLAGGLSRGEVFTATAAFYAVAVVFVGSTSNACGCT